MKLSFVRFRDAVQLGNMVATSINAGSTHTAMLDLGRRLVIVGDTFVPLENVVCYRLMAPEPAGNARLEVITPEPLLAPAVSTTSQQSTQLAAGAPLFRNLGQPTGDVAQTPEAMTTNPAVAPVSPLSKSQAKRFAVQKGKP